MTDQEAIVKLHEKRQRGKELKRKIAAMKDDLKMIVKEWSNLGSFLRDHPDFRYLVGNDSIDVRNPGSPATPPKIPGFKALQKDYWAQVHTFSKASFNGEHIFSRLSELEEAKIELAEVEKYCEDAGDPL
jgi:hypothetical protein